MHATQNDTVRNNTFSPTQIIHLSIYLLEAWMRGEKEEGEEEKKETENADG